MKPLFKSKISLWASILALVVIIGVGATLAYLSASDSRLTNTFSLAEVDTEINEDLTDGNKTVTVKNVGKSPVYIRARLMVSGIDPENVIISSDENATAQPGQVVLVMPNLTNTDTKGIGWQQTDSSALDNFYYFKQVVYGSKTGATPSGTPTETSALLKKVVFADDLKTKDFLDNFSVTVYHESVLAQDTTKDTADAIEAVFESAQATP